jgi:hypothetical protein
MFHNDEKKIHPYIGSRGFAYLLNRRQERRRASSMLAEHENQSVKLSFKSGSTRGSAPRAANRT